jgi:hypothetical protein
MVKGGVQAVSTKKRLAILEAKSVELAGARSYREFLHVVFKIWAQADLAMNYAEFARRAGLAARSFPRAVMNGEKKLSESSLPLFLQALGLRGNLRDLFRLLVAKEERLKSILGELTELNVTKLDSQIERIRTRLAQKRTRIKPLRNEDFFRNRIQTLIFAGAGSLESGSDINTISSRTGIAVNLVTNELPLMEKLGMIKFDTENNWVWPLCFHIDITNSGRLRAVEADFIESSRNLEQVARRRFSSDDELFFQSVFSVKKSNLGHLKVALRDLLLTFAEENEDSDGDRLMRIVTGFFKEEVPLLV